MQRPGSVAAISAPGIVAASRSIASCAAGRCWTMKLAMWTSSAIGELRHRDRDRRNGADRYARAAAGAARGIDFGAGAAERGAETDRIRAARVAAAETGHPALR